MAPAQPPAKRPLSAWLMMLVLVVITLAIAFGAVSTIWYLIAFGDWMNFRFLFDLAIRLAMIACCVAGLVGIARRLRWGRWLGLFLIAALTVMIILMPDTAQYDNETQRSGGAFGRMILAPLLMALWGYRFGFSAKARRYFGN
ncbi:hypothetical protein [Massilia sp. CCM 8734]|uniref:hypothetical protein n=1 Tax=Massilia sp. CCM 8734 TaxID=2609283 RepID=UPI00169E2742|nr:hypothetical protein [Massilia sp. CCM 8734]NHZ95912.1 hypothetical protein [Massilia sp. CCM 8734]